MDKKIVLFILTLLLLGTYIMYSPRVKGEFLDNNKEIPKVIHYVWFGSKELPDNVKKAIRTWEKYQPDFQIKRWDEENCKIDSNPFIKGAYKNKRYDFASDYCRIKALENGGIYLDTDMFLNAPLTNLLNEPLILTLQRKNDISASFMAVAPNHPFIKILKEDYENRPTFESDEIYNAPSTWTRCFKKLFHTNYVPARRVPGKYNIYPANILMYDFKGGENVAEHLFNAGSKSALRSGWYNFFREIYLKENALYFPSMKKYFVFKDPEKGYFYNPQNNQAEREKKYVLKYISLYFYPKYGVINFPEDNEKYFLCDKTACYSSFTQFLKSLFMM